MMRRVLIDVVAACGVLVAPLAALAVPSGSVTTTPFHEAPAIGMPVLALLAVALTASAVYRLRRTAGGRVVGVGLVAGVMLLAGLVYADLPTITIDGAECMTQTVSVFDPLNDPETLLTSNCTARIQITDIQRMCNERLVSPGVQPQVATFDMFPECFVGQVLSKGETCSLLACVA